jgi:hypothetical protein
MRHRIILEWEGEKIDRSRASNIISSIIRRRPCLRAQPSTTLREIPLRNLRHSKSKAEMVTPLQPARFLLRFLSWLWLRDCSFC